MASDWKETMLGEVVDIFTGRKDVNQTNPAGRYVFFSCSPEVFRSDDYICEDKAIIIVGNGSYTGTVRFFDGRFDLYQRTYACTLKEGMGADFDIKFLFYYLKKYFERRFMGGTRGSSIPYIVRGDIEDFEIPRPTLHEQKVIAAILSSLDDKIDLLRRQNETLESIAQVLFKEWFIEFTVNGKKLSLDKKTGLPEGWKQEGLDDIAEFLNGLALQNYPPTNDDDVLPVVKIRELRAGITDQTDKASKRIPKQYIVDDGDVLFSWSGSLAVVLWCHGQGALNQHLFKVTSMKYPKWFYYHWLLEHLPFFRSIAEAKATTMGHIQRHHLAEAVVAVPDDRLMVAADQTMTPLLQRTILNHTQIQTLTKLRDTLLPKLMRGEVKVKI